mgnify:CR=1 FL=1
MDLSRWWHSSSSSSASVAFAGGRARRRRDGSPAAIRAGGAVVAYLRDNQRGAVEHINRLQRKHRERFALIDATAQRNLELLANQQDGGRTNTLLEVLDRTRTPMGARLMRLWVIQPLKDVTLIDARLAAVAELLESRVTRQHLRQRLEQVGDLERLMARICCQRANGRDMAALARSLAIAPEIGAALAPAHDDAAATRRARPPGRPARAATVFSFRRASQPGRQPVSYTHLRAHETDS